MKTVFFLFTVCTTALMCVCLPIDARRPAHVTARMCRSERNLRGQPSLSAMGEACLFLVGLLHQARKLALELSGTLAFCFPVCWSIECRPFTLYVCFSGSHSGVHTCLALSHPPSPNFAFPPHFRPACSLEFWLLLKMDWFQY